MWKSSTRQKKTSSRSRTRPKTETSRTWRRTSPRSRTSTAPSVEIAVATAISGPPALRHDGGSATGLLDPQQPLDRGRCRDEEHDQCLDHVGELLGCARTRLHGHATDAHSPEQQ